MYERNFSGSEPTSAGSPASGYHFAAVAQVPTSRAKDAREMGHPLNAQQNQWFRGIPLALVTTSNQTFGVRFCTPETFTSLRIPGSTSTGAQHGLSLKSPASRKKVPNHHAKSSPPRLVQAN